MYGTYPKAANNTRLKESGGARLKFYRDMGQVESGQGSGEVIKGLAGELGGSVITLFHDDEK
jgi:hypothetical protein